MDLTNGCSSIIQNHVFGLVRSAFHYSTIISRYRPVPAQQSQGWEDQQGYHALDRSVVADYESHGHRDGLNVSAMVVTSQTSHNIVGISIGKQYECTAAQG